VTTITTTFREEKRSADYRCGCQGCGKVLNRKAVVAHTVNPWNKNEQGEPKSRSEVGQDAQRAADAEAIRLADVPAWCRDCEEQPNKDLLLAMAAEPERVFPRPEKFWGSAMHTLQDRKQVDSAYDRCECGSACCSGYIDLGGFRINRAGIARAAKFAKEPEACSA
jgi:hypothetical protein